MPDYQAKRFSGLRNTLPPESLKPDDLTAAVNVELDDGGRAARRPGRTLVRAGAVHSLYADDEVCLFVQNGGMYALAPDHSARLVALGLSDAPMAYVSVAGRTYHANGRATGVYQDGYVRGWGISVDDIRVAAQPIPGTLQGGTYLFAMTWLRRRDGLESGTGLVARIDLPDGAGLRFNWLIPDEPGIVQGAIYLSQPNGETLYRAAIVNLDDGSYDYTGGDRLLPLATQWLDKPPAGQSLAHYRGRIYIAVGAYLYATAALGYEYCDLRDYFALDDSRIAYVASVDNGLFVGTERGLYFLRGAAFAETALDPKLDGRCLPGSVVYADGKQATGRDELAGVLVVLMTTSQGVIMGMADGSVVNLTDERYRFALGERGAAVLQHDDTRTQYLLTMADAP